MKRQIEALAEAIKSAGYNVNKFDELDNFFTFTPSGPFTFEGFAEFDNPDSVNYTTLYDGVRLGVTTKINKVARDSFHKCMKDLSSKKIIGPVCNNADDLIIGAL